MFVAKGDQQYSVARIATLLIERLSDAESVEHLCILFNTFSVGIIILNCRSDARYAVLSVIFDDKKDRKQTF